MNNQVMPRAVRRLRLIPHVVRPALLALSCLHLRADVEVGLGGEFSGSPSGQRYTLTWDALAAATYGVHASSNLSGSAPWMAVDLARPTNSAARWMAPEAMQDRRFFRLAAPQTEIFSVEPAVFAPDTAMNLHVLGQFFATGDVVYVDGTSLGAATFLDHTTLQFALPPTGSGTHTVQVYRAGGLLSSFVVTCASVTNAPELVLQEPPELPPAAPVAMRHSKKGYDYYQAQSALSAARKGYDYYQAQSALTAAGLKAKEKANRTKCGSAFRTTAAGELEMFCVDLAVAGRSMDFVWARTYRSRTGPSNSTMGVRWSHSYDVWCVTGATETVVFDGTGRKDTFRLQPNGTFSAPGLFREGVTTNGSFRLTFADSGYWEFDPPPGGSSAGRMVLARLRDRAGNLSTCGYDGAGRLAAVVDDLGRTNSVAYDPTGRISSVTDFSGRSVTYTYYRGLPLEDGAPGDLATVTSPPVTGTPNTNDFPAGKTTAYTYSHGFPDDRENHLLLSTVDPKGQTAAEFVHQHDPSSMDFLNCVSVQRGVDKKDIRREVQTPVPSNRFAVARVFLNDYVGNVTECFYDARQRCVLMREYTGRATSGVPVTSVSNRPAGRLRATDPDYFETAWSWNHDSLCTRVELPGSNSVECVYEADLDKTAPPRKRCDLRVVRERSGGSEPDLVTTFQHDPRFGSDPTSSRMRTRINELESILKNIGILARAAGGTAGPFNPAHWQVLAKGYTVNTRSDTPLDTRDLKLQRLGGEVLIHGDSAMRGSVDAHGALSEDYYGGAEFATSSTDPRGQVTTAGYDAQGNRTILTPPFVAGNDPPSVQFGYDPFGGATSVTHAADANGRRRVDAFVRHDGLVVGMSIDAGAGGTNLTTTFERDARGNVTRCVDPNGNDSLFTWNALDQCVRAESPTNISARARTDFYYDANDNLASVVENVRDGTDALTGTRTDQFTHDSRNRVTLVQRQVDALHSAPAGYAYDGEDNLVTVLGGEGVIGTDPFNAVAFEYDERNLPFREIRAPGSPLAATNTTGYTANGHPATKQYVDASDTTRIAYDGFDRPVSVTDPMGNVVTRTYDACGRLTGSRTDGQTNDVPGGAGNIRLAESLYDYDPAGRCIRTREAHFDPATQAPAGDGFSTTTMGYAPNGDLLTVADDLGRVTSFAYDTAGRCAGVWDPLSNRVEFAYDAAGNVVAETTRERSDLGGAEQVFVRISGYDRLHRLTRSADNAGNTNRWVHDSLGRCVKAVDPRGFATFHEYDLLGRRTATIGDLNGDGVAGLADDFSERATWSTSNPARQLSTIDGHDNVTSFAYDALDRCTNRTGADGRQHTFAWNSRADLGSVDDPNGTHVAMTYDLNHRCVSRTITPGPGVATNTTFEAFEFDGLARLVRARDDDCDARFSHDSLGNCVRETMNGLATVSTYDSLGRRTSLTCPGGRSFTLARDALGRCGSISEKGLALAVNEYDGPSRLARISYANNLKTRIFYDGLSGTTNAPGDFGWRQVRAIRHAVSGAQPVINDTTYAWDRAGGKSARVETLHAPAIPRTNSLALAYDPVRRLTNAVLTSGTTLVRDTTYSLDRVGNRTNVTGLACSGAYTLDATAPSPQDFQMNRYSSTPCDARQYDANGNLGFVGAGPVSARILTYDHDDRPVSIVENGNPLATYAYDALGRCVSKTVYPGGFPPVTTTCLHDGNDVIEEREGTNIVATYLRLGAGNNGIEHPGTGLISMRRGGADYYVHADDLGNVLALTDTNGLCVERYDYDDYGAVTFLTGDGLSNSVSSSVVGNPYLYQGMRYEPESTLHRAEDRDLLGLRNYDPSKGYLVGDAVIHGASIYEARTGRPVNRRPVPNIPPLPGMNPGALSSGNNPWSPPSARGYGQGTCVTTTRGHGYSQGTCVRTTRNVLQGHFETGDIPDQEDFRDFIDSALNLSDDGLSVYRVDGGGGRKPCPNIPRPVLKDFFQSGDVPTSLVSRNVLKSFFEKGDKPTQAQGSRDGGSNQNWNFGGSQTIR